MSSEYTVPKWNVRHQRQEGKVEGEIERPNRRSSHVHHHQKPPTPLVHMSNYQVAELTWENGQLAMHELGGILPLPSNAPKATWGRTGDTLESIVHQATYHSQNNINLPQTTNPHLPHKSSVVASSSGKWAENSSHREINPPGFAKKRVRSEYSQCGRNFSSSVQECVDRSACASASATFCRDNDTTMMTWASFESPRSLKTKSADEDSACHDGSENPDEERETKGETVRSHSTRRSRAAAVHNQSERRRRDRINQKMKALQKLVPNASKTDKASMLDEVIVYLKQLQAQVQMMSVRNMPQMMMPLGVQQQLQMSLLARMGMGVGLGMNMGMLDMSALARASPQSLSPLIHPNPATTATPSFIPPPFLVPPMIQRHIQSQASANQCATNTSVPFTDPYCTFLAQSMNMELYNKMAAEVYQQQVNQAAQATSGASKSNHVQGE